MMFTTATKLSEALRAGAIDLTNTLAAQRPATTARMDRWITWTPPATEGEAKEQARGFDSGTCTTCLVGAILIQEYNALERLEYRAELLGACGPARPGPAEHPPDEAENTLDAGPAKSDTKEPEVTMSMRSALGTPTDGPGQKTVDKLMSIEDARHGYWMSAMRTGKWAFDGDPDDLHEKLEGISPPRPMFNGAMTNDEAKTLAQDILGRVVPALAAAGV